jgi:hypothetical protein
MKITITIEHRPEEDAEEPWLMLVDGDKDSRFATREDAEEEMRRRQPLYDSWGANQTLLEKLTAASEELFALAEQASGQVNRWVDRETSTGSDPEASKEAHKQGLQLLQQLGAIKEAMLTKFPIQEKQ